MQAGKYQNMIEESQTEEQITVGVPVPGPQAQHIPQPKFNPYPQIGHPPIINHPQPQPQPQNPVPNPQIPNLINYNNPINLTCPCCSTPITTIVANQPGNATYIWAGLLCFFINPCCICVPFLTDRCMDRNHFCPRCGFHVMKKNRGVFECQ